MSANNIIWLDVIREFTSYIQDTIVYDYNDITDVVRVVDNIEAIPNDSQKYFIRYDENNDTLNTILSYDSGGTEIYNYTPVYKDRIIFTDTDSELPNFIFQDYGKWIDGVKVERTVQREEGVKYNNSIAGDKGLSIFEGFSARSTQDSPSLMLMLGKEENVNMFNRTNQPRNAKSFTLNMQIVTANEDLFNDIKGYDALYELEKYVAQMWGDYLSYCGISPYRDLITDSIMNPGEMINEVTLRPCIVYNMANKISYR